MGKKTKNMWMDELAIESFSFTKINASPGLEPDDFIAVHGYPQGMYELNSERIEDMDNREIAKIMGKSEGALRVMQMRALAALRKELSKE